MSPLIGGSAALNSASGTIGVAGGVSDGVGDATALSGASGPRAGAVPGFCICALTT
jgi:hypothetical protein